MTPPHVIVVTGSRHARDMSLLTGALSVLHHQHPEAVLFAGGADGADDLFTRAWAALNENRTVGAAIAEGLIAQFTADWAGPCDPVFCQPGHRRPRRGGGDYCPAAGPRRNDAMCAAAAAAGCPVTTLAVCKLGARNEGTSDCITAMHRHGLPVPVILTEGRNA